ncbi:MAG TPA: SIS domain-containing protein, partial [Candidatus Saccharimonadales bacterium]|nr:SIS domain-containing protein [Candidatus Saccharimonadales bacterium]
MIDLNNKEEILKIDPLDTAGTVEKLAKQCKVAWEEVNALKIEKFDDIQNIVFCGMGASMYGAMVIKSLLGSQMPLPSEIVSDYLVPGYVNENTLVVLTSYSGTTEEVLSCAHDARSKGAKMVVLTKGGPLAAFAKANDIPSYIFDGKLNAGNVPRLGAGYSILGLIGLLNKVGAIDIEDGEISDALTRFVERIEDIKQRAQTDYKLYINKIPVIFAAEHLAGNAQILRNQFNETSKTFSCFFLIPDLNHHLMEGLQFPENAPLQFTILNSLNYSDKIKKRISLTLDVVRQNKRSVNEFTTEGSTVYEDFLETLQYGCFVTLYLGLHYNQNPAT